MYHVYWYIYTPKVKARFSFLATTSSVQVQVAPKAKAQARSPKIEEMAPKTCREQVTAKLAEWLTTAARARTASIHLSSLKFADELAKKLLLHATAMEKAYRHISDAIKSKNTKEKEFQDLLETMNDKLKTHDKLQACKTQSYSTGIQTCTTAFQFDKMHT